MKTKSTYSLLLNADSEEKGRSIFETATYAVVVLSMALSVWYFASGAVTFPAKTGLTSRPNASSPILRTKFRSSPRAANFASARRAQRHSFRARRFRSA